MIKRPLISKQEIVADLLYVLTAAIVSALLIFIFDIHWSFYEGETLFPPSRRVFSNDLTVYFVGVPLGSLVGFFILKLIFFAFMKDEEAHNNGLTIKIKKGKAFMGKG